MHAATQFEPYVPTPTRRPGRPARPAALAGPPRPEPVLRCACGGSCPACGAASAQQALNTPSKPLDAALQARLEPAFGGLPRVRIHDDAVAARSAQTLSAAAWTWGRHIVFAPGAYRPDTRGGQALLAHELVHVAQHEGVPDAALPAEVAAHDDAAEHAARRHVQALNAGERPEVARSARPKLQRSFVSGLLDVLLFVPRLFGAEAYPAEQLREYLAELRVRKGPAETLFSDNKARACIKREAELGPFDTQTKVWLVQDLLHGWTSGPDERAIITLLRRSNDRAAVVSAVGRARLWDDFSGRNRREIEALTMTAVDAGDALVARLRRLDADEIQDYVSHATDPAVRAAAQRAAAFASMTAPVPDSATLNAAGHADFVINGVQVVVEPDRFDPAVGEHAYTHSDFHYPVLGEVEETPETAGNTMADVDPLELRVTLWTTYASEAARRAAAGYGVGTRPEDEKSLQAHERAHGQGWFDFLRDNPPPEFGPRRGLTVAQYNAAVRRWNAAMKDYVQRAGDFAQRAGDCVGKLPTDAQLAGTGFTAAICHTP